MATYTHLKQTVEIKQSSVKYFYAEQEQTFILCCILQVKHILWFAYQNRRLNFIKINLVCLIEHIRIERSLLKKSI